MVRFGLDVATDGAWSDVRLLVDIARAAEAAGWDGLFLWDILLAEDNTATPVADPWIALAAIATATERIRLGILVVPLARYQPWTVAKQAATLDRISNGRLVFGVAVGGREDDYEAAGVDFHSRGRLFDQMLEQWRRIWAGQDFGTAGGIGPEPYDGRPTLVIGGTVDAAFERAAEFADGWIMGGGTPDQLRDGVAKLDAAWRAAGREGEPRAMALAYFALGADAEQAAARYLRHYYAFLGGYADAIAASAAMDPDTVEQRVAAFADAGCDELFLLPSSADPEQVDLLADAIGR